MSRQVDIWWVKGGRLKASMRWTNKRGRISFFLIPTYYANCEDCPFWKNPLCCKWKLERKDPADIVALCNLLWEMPGDNKFENKDKIVGWQPTGPIKRGKRKG